MQMTINPLNFLIKETESGFRWKQMSHVFLHGNRRKSSCTLCGAAAYCCGAVALGVTAALLGRFLPRLGPLLHQKRPFFLCCLFSVSRACWHQTKTRPRVRSVQAGRSKAAFIPLRPGTGRGRRTGSWSPARRRGCRNRSPLAQSAGRARAAVRPCRSRG